MPLVVTGISQTADVMPLEKALRDAGISVEPLSVYSSDEGHQAHPDSGARFIYTGTDSIRDMLSAGTVGLFATGGGRTPGLELTTPEEYFRSETLDDELSELDIPDSELENYEEAIEAGRALVAYLARPETIASVEGVFRAAGLANVRTY